MKYLLMTLILLTSISLHAQNAVAKQLAADRIAELREGTLVWVIPSDSKKLAVIDDKLADVETSSSQRTYLNKERRAVMKQQERFKKQYVKAWKSHYEFSDLVYCYDVDLRAYRSDASAAVFYTIDGEGPQSISEEEPLYFLRAKRTDYSNETAMEIWQIQSSDFHELAAPFPGNYRRYMAFLEVKPHKLVRRIDETLLDSYLRWHDR